MSRADTQCHSCGKKSHIAPICPSKAKFPSKNPPILRQKSHRTRWVNAEPDLPVLEGDSDDLPIYTLSNSLSPLNTSVLINGKSLEMEIDTGATISIISWNQHQLFPDLVKCGSQDLHWGADGGAWRSH